MVKGTSPRQTCLFFGTFNPIHVGHLVMAQSVFNQFAQELELASITFIPAANPPHRQGENDMASARQRLKMVQMATASNPHFKVSGIELLRDGPSYTAETVQALLETDPTIRKPIPMIIGSDSVAQLDTWRQPQILVESLLFLQVVRPEHPLVTHVDIQGKTVALNTQQVDMPELEISATWIRAQLKTYPNSPHALRYLLPDKVLEYIRENRLYQD